MPSWNEIFDQQGDEPSTAMIKRGNLTRFSVIARKVYRLKVGQTLNEGDAHEALINIRRTVNKVSKFKDASGGEYSNMTHNAILLACATTQPCTTANLTINCRINFKT